MINKNTYFQWPDEKGYFGQYGGRYVAETLMPLIMEVEKHYIEIKEDEVIFNFVNFENLDAIKLQLSNQYRDLIIYSKQITK